MEEAMNGYARLPWTPMMSARFDPEDDGHREAPRHDSLGDTAVPCIWWHPDIGGYCARCGSARIDLHAGEWVPLTGLTFGRRVLAEDCQIVVQHGHGSNGGLPWTDRQRKALGLPVEDEWWHQAAGWPTDASDAGTA